MAAKSKCVSYKRTKTTSLKAAGILNIEDNGIFLCTEDGDKELKVLLSDFQGAAVQLSATVKDIDELPLPDEE